MKLESLQDLFFEQLQDLYSAEQQIMEALPKMYEKTHSAELKKLLLEHLDVTRSQLHRLDQIFNQIPKIDRQDEECKGMEGIIKEGEHVMKEARDAETRDAGIIASAQKVEHYEISGYGTARTYAQLLSHPEWAALLQTTLDEEREADRKLSAVAERINVEAKAA